MDKNELEKDIADVRHNIECLVEAQLTIEELDFKKDIRNAQAKLRRLLNLREE